MRPARDRLEKVLARLDARSADERVFTLVFRAEARAAADAADDRRERGAPLGPLDGRIVSVKDILDVAGEVTLAGSASRKSLPAARADAVVVERLRRAGAVIVGRTAMTELAFLAVGPNRDLPWPSNAVDPLRVPGGSSSGAGVSVADGTSEIAIGSDTGGSIRIPAALNGVVGFKPSAGRIPLDGAVKLSPSLDTLGLLARSVSLCAEADAVMAGGRLEPLVTADLRKVRFGVPRGRLFDRTETVVGDAFAAGLLALERAGAKVIDIEIDNLVQGMADATKRSSIASLEAAEEHRRFLVEHGDRMDPRVGAVLKRKFDLPRGLLDDTLMRWADLAARMDQRLDAVDALVLPTVPIVAPLSSKMLSDEWAYDDAEGLLLRNTQIANQFDLCALSLPMPMPSNAMPAGLMLVMCKGHDRRLLAVGAAVEQVLR